ncbi:hypothetical protein FM104_04675 [Microbacterium esteraromaticum]|uniref:Uncharacterized protein n=1 Tax=Microbacterium esteraromaticum TaxID=57043 RepID=A0A1R4IYM7_9MICO|nr:hypothetical protein [Microbacterium esteraromaticum]SJN24986.1 hypothetical protein FM104_04675 [Microbacterium esteraromaticum]
MTLFLTGIGTFAAGLALTAAFVGALLLLALPPGRRDPWYVVYGAGVFISLLLSIFIGNWWWFGVAAATLPVFLGIRWLYRRYVRDATW